MTSLSRFYMDADYRGQVLRQALERDELIHQIAVLTQTSPNEVVEFVKKSQWGLEFIRAGVMAGAGLDDEEIRAAVRRAGSDQTIHHG